MTSCAYCGRPATKSILSNPDRVCSEHALEFWTGLLAYSNGRTRSQARASAIVDVVASPRPRVGFALPLAS